MLGTSCVLENEQATCICIAVDWYVDLCLTACVHLAIVIIFAFDFLTVCGLSMPLVMIGFFDHSNNCMCNFNCDWKKY